MSQADTHGHELRSHERSDKREFVWSDTMTQETKRIASRIRSAEQAVALIVFTHKPNDHMLFVNRIGKKEGEGIAIEKCSHSMLFTSTRESERREESRRKVCNTCSEG